MELSEEQLNLIHLETSPIIKKELSVNINAVGKVQINEESVSLITSRFDGYAEKLYVNYVGLPINKGDHILDVYSPELVLAEREFLLAEEIDSLSGLTDSAKAKLLRYGLTEAQVAQLKESKKIQDKITIRSPVKGIVLEKSILEKGAIKTGDALYKLANLESVWVYLELYEYEYPLIRYGQIVTLTADAYPMDTFNARIWFARPELNEDTRTLRVLANVDNRSLKLKPGMFVHAKVNIPILSDGSPAPTGVEGKYSCPLHPTVIRSRPGTCPICGMDLVQIPKFEGGTSSGAGRVSLAVPISAVLDSGLRKVVYVELERGKYAVRNVIVGSKSGDYFPVLDGLKEGELVITKGGFLLDSQFQIKGLPSMMNDSKTTSPVKTHSH
ncbi:MULTISPECIES: efflux RND transporter periplasmic adaptor subunit [unclassified Leptospira]|uniref:efflux RND transporter periplasmic adaptor subunit n=1 Tax=unclassified Leptospira TaxID=2633828 RepID=UPI00034A18F1|nr:MULTISPECIES: efflux RND transporter periplasmic adaptor subunit [unclassified Leptospira]MCR1793113.1 efflux RND transporter periplasmic adaptor subunit [Leptospira sp. id769339]